MVLLCAYPAIFGQENNSVKSNASIDSLNRPSVALVLSGAGPRGFAHIPIIELIEELGIPIDFVLGTSSGAIVGGLYSAGYSGRELAETVLDIDWTILLQDSTSHLLTNAMGTHSAATNLFNVKLDGDLSLNLGGGLLTGQYVYSKLKSLTVKIPSYMDFDNLPIPYRATAVDLVSGDLVLMGEGDIAEAMRSSMTLPGVFEPFPVNGRYYLDGFIRNTLPIGAVRDLGYDIVIAVEISDKVVEDASTLGSNPISVLNQVLAIQQAVVTSQEYGNADLVLFPNLTEFGSADYAFSKEIYEKGKLEAEKFRDELIDLRSKIFDSTSMEDADAKQVAMVMDDGETYFREPISYANLPLLVVDDIVLHNAFTYDEKMIRKEFEKIQGRPIGEKEIEVFLKSIYETSNYLMITSRFNSSNDQTVLELQFYQKKFESVLIGAVQTFEGSISRSSSWEISTAATVQFYDFLGLGGIFSLQGSLLSKSGLEMRHLQPITDKVFLRSTINAFQIIDIEHSGFSQTAVQDSYFREGTAAFALGVFFSPKHKLLNEVGIHWIDSTRTSTALGDGVFNADDLDIVYTVDAYSRYTYNNLDSLVFPSKGFYSDITVLGGVPLDDSDAPTLFEVLSIDSILAVPFNANFSFVLNSFVGLNTSQVLTNQSELVIKYGFTTYDRVFFPHVMQRYSYGIHKLALKADFQFQPDNALTVLGGKLFFGLGGAIGNVWNDYSSLSSLDDYTWQASALTGVRITDSLGINVRIGAGEYSTGIEPFASIDFIVKSY